MAACVCAVGAPAVSAAKRLPDLLVTSIAGVPSDGVGGGTISLRDTVVNHGKATARRSQIVYYLSFDRRRDAKDIRLEGGRSIAPLRAGKPSRGRTVVTLPANLTGMFDLIGCADGTGKVRESRESNNCKTAARAISIHLPPSR